MFPDGVSSLHHLAPVVNHVTIAAADRKQQNCGKVSDADVTTAEIEDRCSNLLKRLTHPPLTWKIRSRRSEREPGGVGVSRQ